MACHKTSETLLGIETQDSLELPKIADSHKTSETLLGIETNYWLVRLVKSLCHKTSETLLGIETLRNNPPLFLQVWPQNL